MAERNEHLFLFEASRIAESARAEAAYHEKRIEWWQGEYERAKTVVRNSVRLDFREYPVSGGVRADFQIVYDDLGAVTRMNEALTKIQTLQKPSRQVYVGR